MKQGRISLSQKVKGNIKIDLEKDNETITVHKNTLLRASTSYLSDWARLNLDIGDVKTDTDALELTYEDLKSGKLSDKLSGWSAITEINPDKLPKLRAKLDERKFDAALKKLASKVGKDSDDFPPEYADLNIKQNEAGDWVLYNGEKPCLDAQDHPFIIPQWKHLVIDMTNGEGLLKLEDMVNSKENFKIKLMLKLEPNVPNILNVSPKIAEKIDGFYANLSAIKYNELRNIAHEKSLGELTPPDYKFFDLYKTWRDQLKKLSTSQKEEYLVEATVAMKTILANLNKYIKKSEWGDGKLFATQIDVLDGYLSTNDGVATLKKDVNPIELHQLLLAMDGMFSRTQNVKGNWKHTYTLDRPGTKTSVDALPKIVDNTSDRILRSKSMENSKCSNQYETLFNAMNAQIKEQKAKAFDKDVLQTEVASGLIAYNYGNPKDFMRPILNPHIVKGSQTIHSEGIDIPDGVRKHVLTELFKNDSVLLADQINRLANDSGKTFDEVINGWSDAKGKHPGIIDQIGKIVDWNPIDIWDKKYKMNVTFSTAFFAQCVNHMVMLGGLSIDPALPTTNIPGIPWTSSENAVFEAEIEADTQVIASNVGESNVYNITKAAAVSAAVNLSKPQVPGQPPESPGYDWETNQEWWTWTGTGSGGDGSTETTQQNTNSTTGTWNGGDSDGGWGSGR